MIDAACLVLAWSFGLVWHGGRRFAPLDSQRLRLVLKAPIVKIWTRAWLLASNSTLGGPRLRAALKSSWLPECSFWDESSALWAEDWRIFWYEGRGAPSWVKVTRSCRLWSGQWPCCPADLWLFLATRGSLWPCPTQARSVKNHPLYTTNLNTRAIFTRAACWTDFRIVGVFTRYGLKLA